MSLPVPETPAATTLLLTLASLGCSHADSRVKHGLIEVSTVGGTFAYASGPTLEHALISLVAAVRIRQADEAAERARKAAASVVAAPCGSVFSRALDGREVLCSLSRDHEGPHAWSEHPAAVAQ